MAVYGCAGPVLSISMNTVVVAARRLRSAAATKLTGRLMPRSQRSSRLGMELLTCRVLGPWSW